MRFTGAFSILCAALTLTGGVRARGAPPEAVQLDITAPIEGKTYTEDFVFTADLTGMPGKVYRAGLRCFGVTHHLLCDLQGAFGPKADRDGKVVWGLYDRYLLPTPGDHTLEISIFEEGDNDPLLMKTVHFRLEKPTPEELEKELKRWAGGLVWNIAKYKRRIMYLDSDSVKVTSSSGSSGSKLSDEDSERLGLLHESFMIRMNAYYHAAVCYEESCMPGEALRALKRAHKVYELDGGTVTSGPGFEGFSIEWQPDYVSSPPRHFWEFAAFYARRQDLKRAERWFMEYAAWYKRQHDGHPFLSPRNKEKCLRNGAAPYRELAKLHYMIYQDMSAYKQWMEKYRANTPAKRARSTGVNLLDTERN